MFTIVRNVTNMLGLQEGLSAWMRHVKDGGQISDYCHTCFVRKPLRSKHDAFSNRCRYMAQAIRHRL